jgi:hypothetical protein
MRAVATSGGLNRESETHGGTEFAALLVKTSYKPEATCGTIPGVGGDVIAVAKNKPGKK